MLRPRSPVPVRADRQCKRHSQTDLRYYSLNIQIPGGQCRVRREGGQVRALHPVRSDCGGDRLQTSNWTEDSRYAIWRNYRSRKGVSVGHHFQFNFARIFYFCLPESL